MSNAAAWNDEILGRAAADKRSAGARLFVLWGVILALTIFLSGWVYVSSKASLRQRATQVELRWGVGGSEASVGLLGHLDQMAIRVGVVGLAGAVTCLVAFSAVVKRLRQQATIHLHKYEEAQTALLNLRTVLTDARKTKEEALQEQGKLEEQYKRLTAEKSQLEEDGKATFVNPTVAKLTGWPVDELVGKNEHEIFVTNGCSPEGLSADERVLYRKDG